MDEFNAAIFSSALTDLKTSGNPLSWSNKSSTGNFIYERLDRVLVNDMWLQDHPHSYGIYKAPGISDHSPITVSLTDYKSINPKSFKLTRKLKEVNRQVREWNRDIFGRIDERVPLIRKALEDSQSRLVANPSNQGLIDEEISLRDDLFKASRLEESMVHQKSRLDWLQLGDSNSKFFHSVVRARNIANNIMALEKTNCNITTNPEEIADIPQSYFSSILNSQRSQTCQCPDPIRKISDQEASWLSRSISNEEIEDVVLKAPSNKAPGPDVFNGSFFQHFWPKYEGGLGIRRLRDIKHGFSAQAAMDAHQSAYNCSSENTSER
ncbi:uncharacterized protein LOC143861656 [Tasmannia lanceolata]|uniref:uncharacterized protein LOC143861656 n=1 Tax=Tasmannia lanceolata TaxID=3420 RepID=UPI004062A411